MVNKSVAAAAALLVAAAPLSATAEPEAAPVAAPADVASIDAVMTAVYEVISGPAGAPRDWDRFVSLFHEDARLIPYASAAPGGAQALSPTGYVERAQTAFQENGFFEVEIGRRVELYGDIAHAFSAYEARRNEDDAEPFLRGVNSFQLIRHEGAWRVMTIFWQAETPDNPVPEDLIGAK
ncbi:MAG: hypothetical protein AAGC56_13970 [Pseudomonadota bacterium]